MTEDDRLKVIDTRLCEIDEQLDRLKGLKRKLLAEREKLTDKRNLKRSEELSTEKWHEGNYLVLLRAKFWVIDLMFP